LSETVLPQLQRSYNHHTTPRYHPSNCLPAIGTILRSITWSLRLRPSRDRAQGTLTDSYDLNRTISERNISSKPSSFERALAVIPIMTPS
jgi:hypothetical protein